MSDVTFICAYCGARAAKPAGAVNRAVRAGLNVYCSRVCSGLVRRKWKSQQQKKHEKSEYDAARRDRLAPKIKEQKAAYFKRTYNPEKAAVIRRERMPYHVEYCRTPQYKTKKAEYDLDRRASEYGAYAEAYKLLLDISRAVNDRMSDYDVRVANGTLNKRLKRRREYAALISGRP